MNPPAPVTNTRVLISTAPRFLRTPALQPQPPPVLVRTPDNLPPIQKQLEAERATSRTPPAVAPISSDAVAAAIGTASTAQQSPKSPLRAHTPPSTPCIPADRPVPRAHSASPLDRKPAHDSPRPLVSPPASSLAIPR